MIGDLTHEYDKAGNRTKIGGSWARTGMPEALTTTSYDAANRQLTFGDKTLTYDDNGNIVSISDSNGTTLYTWNARGQLAAISGPNLNASFTYDGLGRREAKTVNGNLTEFLYDGVNPVQESSGAVVSANVLPGLGVDEFFSRTDVTTGTTSSFLSDALGSTIALVDSGGIVGSEYTYEPFGRTSGTGAPNSNSYQYTARENDGTGVYYYRARYYKPEIQRFINEDPLEFAGGGPNIYAYVGNNPIHRTDPSGLAFVDCESLRKTLESLEKMLERRKAEREAADYSKRDRGHEKAIEQLQRAVDAVKEQLARHCKSAPQNNQQSQKDSRPIPLPGPDFWQRYWWAPIFLPFLTPSTD